MEIPNNKPQIPNKSPDSNSQSINKWSLVSLASELGFIIALPLVGFGLLGKWLDRKYDHEVQWITLIGIALAITLTTLWLVRRFKTLLHK